MNDGAERLRALAAAGPRGLGEVASSLEIIEVPGGGEGASPVVMSLMLHGNEPAGILALQHLVADPAVNLGRLPRPLVVLVGNTEAAALGRRVLDDQRDFNRIWYDTEGAAADVARELEDRRPLCLFDLHNSSGRNPCFVGVTRLDRRTLGLAHAFSLQVVNVVGPVGMLGQRLAATTPSVTLECGAPTNLEGPRLAARLIARLLLTGQVPELPVAMPVEVLEHMVTLRLADGARLAEADEDLVEGQVRLDRDVEQLNFRDAEIGSRLGRCAPAAPGSRGPMRATTDDGEDLTDRFLRCRPEADGTTSLVMSSPAVPVMLTLDELVIRRDCFGYLMKRRRLETS